MSTPVYHPITGRQIFPDKHAYPELETVVDEPAPEPKAATKKK